MQQNIIGIRREDLSKKGEKRVAIPPNMAADIVAMGHSLLVQPAANPETGEVKRAFTDADFAKAGAIITEDLSSAQVIFGLKEVGIPYLIPQKAYLFFSHTHKGQVKNRQLLQTLVNQENTLIDYELIADDKKQRVLTAFTYFAGYAGMIDSMWALGQRLNKEGIPHPFRAIPQSIEKEDLGLIEDLIRKVGIEIEEQGLPVDRPPLITCFLGNGKTSHGAQQIYDLLPAEEIKFADLPKVFRTGSRNKVYKLVLDIPDMFRFRPDSEYHLESLSFDEKFQLYLREPDQFESNIDQVFPYCTMMMNCIIWSPEFPRLISREDAAPLYEHAQTLRVIGDITCDPEGAIQFSQETWIDDPVFTYDPYTDESWDGFEAEGITVMAVTNLPCEFSADASTGFGHNLASVLEGILKADFNATSPKASGLPLAVQRAVILWKGKFTPSFAYMEDYLAE